MSWVLACQFAVLRVSARAPKHFSGPASPATARGARRSDKSVSAWRARHEARALARLDAHLLCAVTPTSPRARECARAVSAALLTLPELLKARRMHPLNYPRMPPTGVIAALSLVATTRNG